MLKLLDVFDVLHELFWVLIFTGGMSYAVSGIVIGVICDLLKLLVKKTIPEHIQNKVKLLISACVTSSFAYDYCADNYPTLTDFVVLLVLAIFLLLIIATEDGKKKTKNSGRKANTEEPKHLHRKDHEVTKSAAKSEGDRDNNRTSFEGSSHKTAQKADAYIDPALRNPSYRFTTKKGECVRSLGEQIIADKLFQDGVEYEYGPVLRLEKAALRPSFKVKHPNIGAQYYWEHYDTTGDLQENYDYLMKSLMYKKLNIVEGVNLIITTNNDLEEIQKYVENKAPSLAGDINGDATTVDDSSDESNFSFHHSPYVYDTLKGEKVRSLGEATIANMLYRAGIKYEYERLIQLGDVHIRPDFAIHISPDGEMIYWEHCGMMSDPEYRKKWKRKKETYKKHGIIEGEKLIVTTSTDPIKLNRAIDEIRASM